MKYEKRTKAVLGAVWIFLCCVLSGCSLSFCGLTVGGKEELEFTCEEGLPEDIRDTVRVDDSPSVFERVKEVEESEVTAEEKPVKAQAGKVNLNTASLEELMTLNGIGETRAEAILEYRKQHGLFTKIEDIMMIPGIKEGIFSKIREQITVH